jgi:PST family polysaccharide transporter
VRQIAEAAGTGNTIRIARTAAVLKRVSVVLGIVGAVLLIALSRPITLLTFGNAEHTFAVALLSIAVLLRVVAAGQGALIQGMRRIYDYAMTGVLGAVYGAVISIPLVYFLRENGIIPSLIAVAAMSLACSWWYSRKVKMETPPITVSEVRQEAGALLKLGIAFMASGLMTMGAAYIVRITVLHQIGVDATGLYQSAWTLGGLYVGFILQAMGADFYPRLTGRCNDNPACNRMVNEQAQIGLLLAGPGVIATLTFAPLVLVLFYSAKFVGARDLLRWICLGVSMRVISWPMGFIILAKGIQSIFFWCELAWTVVNVGLTWICVQYFGLTGAGIAFFGSYIFHALLIYSIVSRISGFHWSPENKKTGALFLLSVGMVFCGFYGMPLYWALGLGVAFLVVNGVFSIRTLLTLFPADQISRPLLGPLRRFGLAVSK